MMFNDVLYRLKTSDDIRDPLRVFVTDKEYAKQHIMAVVGDKYNVPTIAVLHSKQEVAAFAFPDTCCIKATHGCGQVILRQNGEAIDRDEIQGWFDVNYYRNGREENYRYLKPKVIVEPLIFGIVDPPEFKFFCWNGDPRFVRAVFGPPENVQRALFDMNWTDLDYGLKYPKAEILPPRPETFDEMKSVVAKLAEGFRGIIRIDLYSDGQTIRVGELTNINSNATSRFTPPSAEEEASAFFFGSGT
ncbi:ATP-grasp fold amidoligase family protein [Yoonia sp. GPGPB17]|uniref:ATP-grasp fold amidoligase family protein n=1 Tax=Yoonia sp. GPGPB17 TaxID=3026147 RepID=UPI0030C3DEF1